MGGLGRVIEGVVYPGGGVAWSRKVLCVFFPPSVFIVSVLYTVFWTGLIWSSFVFFCLVSGRWGVTKDPTIRFLGLAFSTPGNGRERSTFGNGMALGSREGKEGEFLCARAFVSVHFGDGMDRVGSLLKRSFSRWLLHRDRDV